MIPDFSPENLQTNFDRVDVLRVRTFAEAFRSAIRQHHRTIEEVLRRNCTRYGIGMDKVAQRCKRVAYYDNPEREWYIIDGKVVLITDITFEDREGRCVVRFTYHTPKGEELPSWDPCRL